MEGGRYRGLQRKCWMDMVNEWTSLSMQALLIVASSRKDWKKISAALSVIIIITIIMEYLLSANLQCIPELGALYGKTKNII